LYEFIFWLFINSIHLATLTNIATANPSKRVEQSTFAEFYGSLAEDSDTARKINFLSKKSGIDTRFSVLPVLTWPFNHNLTEKMELFHLEAQKLAFKAVVNLGVGINHSTFTDLIVVSCTGMRAPGLEYDLIRTFSLPTNIHRYNINFMGCYAGIIALRLAKTICQQPNRKVLIVSVELCTLHFQKSFADDYLLSNLIFGDGSAAAIVSSEEDQTGLRLDGFTSDVLPESKNAMAWNISEHGFLMELKSTVPKIIHEHIHLPPSYNIADLDQLRWAVHPGGVQILDVIEQKFKLKKTALLASRDTLRKHGNMSSATILFILKQLLDDTENQNPVFACAFGPGLTFETLYANYVGK
jgi:predicted naringenin-chalcone synthase